MVKTFSTTISYVVMLCCIISVFKTQAQQRPYIKPKIFVAKDGTVYWNRKLPVYLKLSTGADTGQTVLLTSKISAKYVNPFFLDSEGPNYFRTKWAVDPVTGKTVEPKQEIVWEVINDGKPPFSKPSLNGSRSVTRQKKLYFKKEVTLTLDGYDAISGLDVIYVSVNGAPFELYEKPIVISEAGQHHIQFFCVDKVGNAEPTQHLYFTIDHEAPKSSYQIKGTQYQDIVSASAKIILEATDDAVGVEKILYRADSGAWKVYQAPISAGQLGEGQHTIEFYAADYLGDKGESQSFDLYVDTKPPYVSLEIIGDRYSVDGKNYSSGRTRIKLTALDNKAGIKSIWYSINDEPFQMYEKPFYLTGKGGFRKIKYYAVDNVNNKTSNDNTNGGSVSMPYLDVTGPSIQHKFVGSEYLARDTVFISPKTKISLTGTDLESGVQKITYRINGGPETDYTAPFVTDATGYTDITIIAYDQVNNTNQKNIQVMIDTAGPEIYVRFSVPPKGSKESNGDTISVYPPDTEIYLAATDEHVGTRKIYYALNNGTEKLYEAPIHGFIQEKYYVLHVTASDWLGNTTKHSTSFYISK